MRGSLRHIANKRMEEIQDLSKQINVNNLSYHYIDKNDLKKLIGFKGLLNFNRSIKKSNITEKPEEQQREFKSESNKIVKGSKTSEDQTSTAAVDTQHLKVEVVD